MESIVHSCTKCSFTSMTVSGRAWNFPFNHVTKTHINVCNTCTKLLTTFNSSTTWVYVDPKLEHVETPKRYHFSIKDEKVFRNLISLGDQVFVSDGSLVWKWGALTGMTWGVFNRIHIRWKQLHHRDDPCGD